MKSIRTSVSGFLLCAALITGSAQAQDVIFTDPQKPFRSFEAAWAEYESLLSAPGTTAPAIRRHLLDIFEGYPEDPRRWNAAVDLISSHDGFVIRIKADPLKYGPDVLVRDEQGREAWHAYTKSLYGQMLAHADALPADAVRKAMEAYMFYRGDVLSPADLVATMDDYTRRFPDAPMLAGFEARLHDTLERSHPDLLLARMQKLVTSANPDLRAFAEGKMRLEQARTEPMRMTFTAADGRKVDLDKLRGKVVLIDFWATWCGPCMDEVPRVKKLYEQYRREGFEVVGIALEQAPVAGESSRFARTAQDLVKFTKKEGMAWPNHYDGRRMENEYAVKYGIKVIPRAFLLDRNGLLVAMNVRGEELATEVGRLMSTRR